MPKGTVQVTAPKQKRSRETYESLLDAAEQLLDERRLEEISVADVVAKAGSSVGSFYARFSGKEALVLALVERYHDDTETKLASALENEKWKSLSLRSRARRFVGMVVKSCRQRRGLLRLRLQLRLSESIELPDEHEKNIRLVEAIRKLFEPVKKEIRRRDKERALAFALRMVDAMASTILIEDVVESFGALSDDELVERISDAFVSYLT